MSQELGTPLLSRNQPGKMSREPCSGLWRSEDMVLLQLHMQREAAHDTVYKLGQLGCVQFRDMNEGASAFQRLFTTDVRRCEDSERRLRYFEEQLKRAKGLKTVMLPDGQATETLDQLEPKLEGFESELRELNSKWELLLTQKNSMQEHLEILGKEPEFFSGDDSVGVRRPGSVEEDLGMRSGGLRYMTGVISTAQLGLFERLVYRVTRGNMFMRTAPAQNQFEDPATGNKIDKTVFVIFVSAQRAHDKIKKVCESLQATLYPYNIDNREEVQKMHINVRDNLSDLENTIAGTESVRDKILMKIKENVYQWKKTVVIEKSVYNILNFLSFKGQTVVAVAECWVPKNDVGRVEDALHEAERSSGAQVQSFLEAIETRDKPPTYFKTNKFTASHQGIVDSYGIARYKEVNPACFSVITFPFLFGVMYGDIGHGVMITLLALLFIWKEKKMLAAPLNEIIALVFGGRYILVIMGIYAIYMGFLYNDLFSLMISFGEPYWIYPKDYADAKVQCDPGYLVWYGANASNIRACKKLNGSPYLFGIDSAWAETENKLEFMNGLKMKMAVILGVIQMTLGLVLQCFNHVHFKDTKHIICGFIPEVVFLLCTFGYMCVMIIIKWCVNWPERMLNNLSPPSLLETMTNFFLTPGSVQKDKYLFGSAASQNSLQTFLLLLAFAMVPILLIPIPVIEYRHHKHASYGQLQHEDETNEEDPGHKEEKAAGHGEEEAFDMSEVVIKQVIHTIEFVLGCVSNTASYLRLWALSLAHAELSEVFWNFAMMKTLYMDTGFGFMAFIGWGAWGGATVGVLGVMEALSAFLHALRLHWVEFQNKFYYGDGAQFIPFDIDKLLPSPHESSADE